MRPGDRVLQVRNNYEKEVFNGDLGWVRHVDSQTGGMHIEVDGRELVYEAQELDELVLAYAISIHKSQGSEYPAVVIPLVTQHYVLLQRNLIYTGLTRARRLAVLLGSQKAMRIGINNQRGEQRNTYLRHQLRQAAAGA
jgi:exodeoxyribonuclease V alpha subunit